MLEAKIKYVQSLNAVGDPLDEKIAAAKTTYDLATDIERRLEAEQQRADTQERHKRDVDIQQSMLAVSQRMLDTSKSTLEINQQTLKVYKWLKWLTVILAIGTLLQAGVPVYMRCVDNPCIFAKPLQTPVRPNP